MPVLRRIATESAVREGLRCSFCGNEPADGSDLVARPHVFICDECIATGTDMLAGEDSAGAEEPSQPDRRKPPGGEPGLRPTFFRLLTEGDVARLITMDDLIDEMSVTLRRFSSGEAVQPLRTVIPLGGENEVFGVMPAYLRAPAVVGVKLVTVFGRNPALDLPTHLATVLLFSPETGALLAVLDGRFMTEARTAAVSAVSADLLARDDASLWPSLVRVCRRVVISWQEHRFTALHIAGEIGELIAGKVEGRRSPRDVTVFKSLGLAVEDVAPRIWPTGAP